MYLHVGCVTALCRLGHLGRDSSSKWRLKETWLEEASLLQSKLQRSTRTMKVGPRLHVAIIYFI